MNINQKRIIMYPLISKWTVLPGKKKEALTALKELAVKVRESEPDTLMYTVHTPEFTQPSLPTPPEGEIIFFEIYKNKAAFHAHVKGPNFTAFVKKYGHLFLNNNKQPYVTLEIMRHQAGFIRPGIM
jgi:quinol monooxygenase YgiN